MAPSASCFVGAPLYFIVPPTSTCTGVCENYVKKNDREKKAKGLSPHARDNQLQVGSSGGPIRPLVAEILIFYLSSAGRENRCSSFLRSADGNEEDWVARRDRTVLTHKKYSTVSYDMVVTRSIYA